MRTDLNSSRSRGHQSKAGSPAPARPLLVSASAQPRPAALTSDFRPPTPDLRLPFSGFSLRNTDGFWELSFNGCYATVPQNQALFYVACLLATPDAPAIPADEFATIVYELFSGHSDFTQGTRWLQQLSDADEVAKILHAKEQALEAIIDSSDEPEPVKNEALRELTLVYDLDKTYSRDVARTAELVSDTITASIRQLYNSLATAVDHAGSPHPLLRAFARHILLYILMPSTRLSGTDTIARFVYEPPRAVRWQLIFAMHDA